MRQAACWLPLLLCMASPPSPHAQSPQCCALAPLPSFPCRSLLVSFRVFTSQQAQAQLPHIFSLLRAALLRQLDAALEAAKQVGGACVPLLPAEQVCVPVGAGGVGWLEAGGCVPTRGACVLGTGAHTSTALNRCGWAEPGCAGASGSSSLPLFLCFTPCPLVPQRDAYIRHVSSTEGLAALAAAVVRNASSVLKVRALFNRGVPGRVLAGTLAGMPLSSLLI